MQVSGQNIQQKNVTQPPYVSVPIAQQTQVAYPQTSTQQAQQTQQPPQAQYPCGYCPVQNTAYPPYQPPVQNQQPQAQTYQIPASTSGVNIQIFNPSVATPGAQAPTYNVNAPCYPSGYYTGQLGPDGKLHPNNINQNQNQNQNTSTNTTSTNTTSETTTKDSDKKTEKRKIVQLTDEYIKNLESYLNSPEKEIRLNAAKEVYARLEEDDSRKDDKALTALINKMLQDPSQEVRFLALTALDTRIVTGDDFTVGVLQKIQNDPKSDRQDALDASNILLKMSSKQIEKEFEVKDKPKKESKTNTTTTKTEKK